jgi:hypothetical protein
MAYGKDRVTEASMTWRASEVGVGNEGRLSRGRYIWSSSTDSSATGAVSGISERLVGILCGHGVGVWIMAVLEKAGSGKSRVRMCERMIKDK